MTRQSIIYFAVAESPGRICKDARYLMRCQKDEEQLCGHGDIYMTYFCLFNQLELRLESRVDLTYASLLVQYQVMHGLTYLWLNETQSYADVTKVLTIIPITFEAEILASQLQSHRYTIKTFYRFILEIGIKVKLVEDVVNHYNTDGLTSVSIFDGPILVISSFLYEMDGFSYIGGFTITCQLDIMTSVAFIRGIIELIFQRRLQVILDVNLANIEDTYDISVDTMKRNTTFYYKYLRVRTAYNFVKLTFTNIRSFSGQSHSCEYGGFSVSDFWDGHFQVTGPYCTRHGTEPLVNDVNSFHSSNEFLTLIIYSYTFQMNVDISFQTTQCEGVTNICNVYCGRYVNYYNNKRYNSDENFVVLYARRTRFSCKVQLQILKQCVMVQRTWDERNAVCIVAIYPRLGVMHTIVQMQSNFK